VFDIQGIQLNFYEAVTGYGESESIGTSVRIKGNQEADYYVGTLSNATHMVSPSNVKSITIQYNGGSVEIPADAMQFVYHNSGNPYYSIESNDNNTHVVLFYNENNGDQHYSPYAVRFVQNGDSLGDKMPANPTYGDANT